MIHPKNVKTSSVIVYAVVLLKNPLVSLTHTVINGL